MRQRQPFLRIFPFAFLFALFGCNSGSDAGSFTPVPETFSISGTVSGLNGSATLMWGDGAFTLQSGTFMIEDAFKRLDSITLALADTPFSQNCVINSQTTFNNQSDDISGVTIDCADRNIARVTVEDIATGALLPNVDVNVYYDNGAPTTVMGTTSAQGQVVFDLPEFNGRVIISTLIAGYAEQSQVVTNSTTPGLHTVRLLVQPIGLTTQFDATAGSALTIGGTPVVTIPANGLVDGSGNAYTGQVTADLTVIDPSAEAALMPGDYLSIDAGSLVSPMESLGGFSLILTGDGGESLNLAPGQLATVNIPVASAAAATAPAAAALFFYDPLTGYASEQGNAVLQNLGGVNVYSGQVDHFSTWSAGVTYVPDTVTGCVVDPADNALANVRIDGTGVNYIGTSQTTSAQDGTFVLPVRPASNVLVTAGGGYQSQTVLTSAGSVLTECLVASNTATTINLSWGEDPADLDTHFFGFSAENSADDFHIDFTQRTLTVNGQTIELDVDDVSSFGPEVVTVPAFPFPGVYRYGVHRFSGDGTIQSSPARVALNLSGDVFTFVPPAGTATDCWAVFDIRVETDGTASMTSINTWEPENYCSLGTFPNPL